MSGRLQCRGVADRLRLIITVEAKEWHRNFWFPYVWGGKARHKVL